jgi:3-oxoacyl-[acyl-carrier protein] reductase
MDAALAGKRFLVTGAAGGIGQAIARTFAHEDAKVVLHYHRSREAAERLAAECPGSSAVQADLRDEAAVDGMFAAIAGGAAGRLDGIVVNAGIWVADEVPIHRMTLSQWQDTLAADLTSAFLTCRAFFRHLAADPRDEASVVLIGSTAGLFGEANHLDYASAKAAMAHGMTATLKNEIVALARNGRVNCVCPGWVRTPMAEAALADPATVARATATMALAKVAEPEDVARAVLYLSSPALSGHVSGTILPVDGGMEGRLLRS